MVKTAVTTLTAALVFLIQVNAHAEDTGTQVPSESAIQADPVSPEAAVVEGDKLELYFDRKLKSIGNAAIHKGEQNIYGDLIEYDVQNENVHVLGNAKLELNDSEVLGPELNMKLGETIGEMKNPKFTLKKQFSNVLQLGKSRTGTDANTSTVTDARTGLTSQQIEDDDSGEDLGVGKRSGDSRGDASVVFFEGENKKRLKDARYTTCSADRDDWYLKASELEIDGYTKTAVAKNATVEFQGVPILYTPWMNFSFANQRKSGFLAPTWGSTSLSGFQVVTPYYWNIAPNMDATFGPRYLSRRGVQFVSEFRYLGESYSGINNIEYLGNDSTTGETRYYAKLQHKQIFGGGLSGGYALEKTSDDKYFSENLYYSRLSTGIRNTSRVLLPQNAYVDYAFGKNWNLNALVSKYQSLVDGIAPYERLPQLTLTNEQDFGLSTFGFVGQWVQFERNNRALTPSVSGSRLVANPSISTTFARPYGYITPKLGVHYTDYNLTNETLAENGVANYASTNRTLPIFSVDSGLFFDRTTRIVKSKYTQTLEPRLFYLYVPYKDQSDLPIFDSSEATLSYGSLFLENQFTGYDRINDANQLTMALTSRMIDNSTGQQRLSVSVGQRFYFSDQRVTLPGRLPSTDKTSDYFAAVTARLKNNWHVDLAGQYSGDRNKLVRSNISARYNPEPGKTFNFGYRYAESRFATGILPGVSDPCFTDPRIPCGQVGLDQLNISAQWPLGYGFYGLGRWNYSLEESKPIEGLAGLEYDAGCWQARGVLQRIATPTADANYALFFQLELGGLASIGQNPMRLLTRGIPGYKPSGSIPESYQDRTDE